MRATLHIAAAIALAWLASSPMALAARPTRSIPRESARRAAVPATLRGASRERASRRMTGAGARGSAPKGSRTGKQLQAALRAGTRSPGTNSTGRGARIGTPARSTKTRTGVRLAVVDPSTAGRVHAWEQTQRYAAARTASSAAIAMADGRAARQAVPAQGAAIPEQDETAASRGAGDAADASAAANEISTAAGQLPAMRGIEQEAATAMILPPLRVASLYDEQGRLMVPAPLYGSREVLLHQNEMADRDGLERVRDDADLAELRRMGRLVELPENAGVRVDERLPENRRYSRPWTAEFLSALARDYYANFQSALLVDSAVRTVAVQRRLLRTNGNAAPISGDTASPHLTGEAIDIGKSGLSLVQIAWMRTYLQPLMALGQIDVEEEFQQACFHISVYRNYLRPGAVRLTVAAAAQSATTTAR